MKAKEMFEPAIFRNHVFGVSVVLLLVSMIAMSNAATAPAGDAGLRCWAVVSTAEIEKTGLADLLTSELSAEDGIELVERDALDLATRELELDALFGAEAASKRLQLGRLLGADALALLSLHHAVDGSDAYVKLVICDCRYGARLDVACVPSADGRVDEICREYAARVYETRRRFADGVRQLIGVTPLLSKDLVHDYDHLQASYACLLETALMGYPGVAVIETSEARAIAKELKIRGEGLKDHIVPLFIAGEYEVSTDAPQAEPTVRLLLRAVDGRRPRLEVRREAIPASQVPDLLCGPVATQIVRLSQETTLPGIDRRRQCELLTGRADAFSRLGAFEHSIGLREAALLIDPDDVDQRLALVGDLLRRQRAVQHARYVRGIESLKSLFQPDGRADFAVAGNNVHEEPWAWFRIVTRHAEEAIRRRTLNPREAHLLVSTVYHQTRSSGLLNPHAVTEEAFEAEKEEYIDRVYWRLYPLLSMLDPGVRQGAVNASLVASLGLNRHDCAQPASPLAQYASWTFEAGNCITFSFPLLGTSGRPGQLFDDSHTLEYMFRFLTEIASPTVPLPWMASMISDTSPYGFNSMIDAGRLERDDVVAFCKRLDETNQPLNQFYGRLILLSLKIHTSQNTHLGPETIEEIDALWEFVRNRGTGETYRRRIASPYEHRFAGWRSEIARSRQAAAREKRHPMPNNPFGPPRAERRIRFEPVGDGTIDWVGLRKCTEQLDVAWSVDTVYAISEGNPARSIFRVDMGTNRVVADDRVYSVAWDGEKLWIACMASGIWVVLPNGTIVGHVDQQQGLPPYDAAGWSRRSQNLAPFDGTLSHPWPLELYPIRRGKCIAIGTFGNQATGTFAGDKRVWFAAISTNGGTQEDRQFEINVFHTATKVPNNGSPASRDDPQVAFDLAWLAEYGGDDEQNRRLLLVGRQVEGSDEFGKGRRPLAIDLGTLEVSVFPTCFHLPGLNLYPRYAVRQRIVYAAEHNIVCFSPSSGGLGGDWQQQPLVDVDAYRRPKLRPVLLEHEGMLYNPGAQWRRIDPRDWSVERFNSPSMPFQDPFAYYGVSARYGLVAWTLGSRLYRVLIEPEPAAGDPLDEETLAAVYPGVPAERLAAHHEAALALRALGASVDTRWGIPSHHERAPWHVRIRPAAYQWRTIVFLPDAWQGGDAGLRHLAGLYNLCDLYLVGADVTDEGLKTIAQIETLESLCLVETRATDAGVASLAGLKRLDYLRLEAAVDAPGFSDRALKYVAELSALQGLVLYGSGFTDAGLTFLEGLSDLRNLWLLDTAITEPALRKLGCSAVDGYFPYDGRVRCHRDAHKLYLDY